MTFQKRKQFILKSLKSLGEVTIKQLAVDLKVSEITARRDLDQLAADDVLFRTHGGAIKIDHLINNTAFINKAASNLKAKDNICRKAANEIVDGDIIFMDCGSTVF